MLQHDIMFWVRNSPFYAGVEMHIARKTSSGLAICEPWKFKFIPEGQVWSEDPPALRFSRQEAQLLMDALYDVGIRPTSGQHSVGQLAATEKHLTDMRKISLNLLKIKE